MPIQRRAEARLLELAASHVAGERRGTHMRLPYLQVTQETWSKARMLAGLLGITRHEAFGLIADLWAWAIDLGPADAPPTGEFRSPRAIRIMAAAVEWRGDPEELAGAFVDLELIERLPDAVRVRGLSRYQRTWEKNQRRKPADMVPVTGDDDAGTGAEPARQTQTQTQIETQIQNDDDDVRGAEQVGAMSALRIAFTVEAPTAPPESWQALDFWRFFQSVRQDAGLVAEHPPNERALANFWNEALLTSGVTPRAMKEAVYTFGKSKKWATADPPFPWAAFKKLWRNFVRTEVAHGTAAQA